MSVAEHITLDQTVKLERGEQIESGDTVWEKIVLGQGENAQIKLKPFRVLSVERQAVVAEQLGGDKRRIKLHFRTLVCRPSPEKEKAPLALVEPPAPPIEDADDPLVAYMGITQDVVTDLNHRVEDLDYEIQAMQDGTEVHMDEKRRLIAELEDQLKTARRELEQMRARSLSDVNVIKERRDAVVAKRDRVLKALAILEG